MLVALGAGGGQAVRLDPSYVKAWTRRGMVRHKRGKYSRAVADFDEALARVAAAAPAAGDGSSSSATTAAAASGGSAAAQSREVRVNGCIAGSGAGAMHPASPALFRRPRPPPAGAELPC